jgi:Tol biopolymer transport system component
VVTPLAAPTGASTFGTPVWSPDGARIAFLRREGGPMYSMSVEIIRPDGSDLVSLWQGALNTPFLPFAWRP